MPRTKRPYLPGAIFHLIARSQGHHHWFTEPVRHAITEFVVDAIELTDATLIAYAVMPNHLHLVVQQGSDPLGRIMMRLLRRTALRVHRVHGIEGHVFERPYRCQPCLDAEYVRNVIVYTHLNPVRAKLAEDPIDYPWTSHSWYSHGAPGLAAYNSRVRGDELTLPLFANSPTDSISQLRAAYVRFIAWRREVDAQQEQAGGDDCSAPQSPNTRAGDRYWVEHFQPAMGGHAASRPRKPPYAPAWRPDLRDIARRVLAEAPSTVPLTRIRRGDRTRTASRLRHVMIERMRAAGHRTTDIANFVGTTPPAVTKVVRVWRRRGTFLPLSRNGSGAGPTQTSGS